MIEYRESADGYFAIAHHANGDKSWYRNGQRHRGDGPAIEGKDYEAWYIDGKFHREGGPAIVFPNGVEVWYRHGKLHREDGPAHVSPDGDHEWFIDGEELAEQEFLARTAKKV